MIKAMFNLNKKVNIIAKCDLVVGTGYISSDNIFHVTIKKNQKVTMETIKLGTDFVSKAANGPYLNLFVFEDFADVDPEVRKWAANDEGNKHTIADAIVISNLPQKILADFYLKFNKPARPTKVFRDVNKAKDWLLKL